MKGHITRRGDAWCIVFDLGRDERGRRRQKWVTVRGSRRDAERELARLQHELTTGAYVAPADMTVAQYLEYWLQHYAQPSVAVKTLEGYTEYVRLHLIPSLGRHKLARLQPAHIQAYYSDALSHGRRKGEGGLSARTVLHHHRVLRQALEQAVRWQFLGRNPANSVVPPRPRAIEQRVLDVNAIAALLSAARPTRLFVPIIMAVTTGMRRGEILGLRWQDVDLAHGTLSVRQTLVQTRTALIVKEPKSRQSRRVVVLPSILVEALADHRIEQGRLMARLGEVQSDGTLVVAEDNGDPRSPRALSAAFASLLQREGLPLVRFHDLRHTHATLLLGQGVHPKVVSERLGHSTVDLTLNTYSHVLPTLQDAAAREVDAALREALRESCRG